MVQLTIPQISTLIGLTTLTGPQLFTLTQNYRGPEESCDHIFVEWPTGSCRIDNEGNRFDNQLKEHTT